MRVIQVVASVEQEASGPSYTVPSLAEALARQGHAVELMTTGPRGSEDMRGYRHSRFPADFQSLPLVRAPLFSSALLAALRRSATEAEIIHNHGLWLMPNVYCAWAAEAARIPLVMAPRGMLGPGALQFSRRKKQAFWRLFQRRAALAAACWHATSDKEYDDIRRFGLRQPVAVIENGIDIPESAALSERPQRRVLYLGRLHPKKGIDRLIAAWARVAPEFPDWDLDIVGPGEAGHEAELKAQAKRLGCARVNFRGPAGKTEKYTLYRKAGVFVLPTQDENFGMTIAEALSVATPVICTVGAPWSGLATNRCGWWIDHGVEPLAATLRHALSLSPEAREEMGLRGRQWMARDFSWDSIAGKMTDLYSWLAGAGERPVFVRAD